MTGAINLLSGELIVGFASGVVSVGLLIYKLWTRQQRHHRALYGSDDDDTRDGLAVRQQEGFQQLNERLDEIEESMERGFSDAERERQETRAEVDDIRDDVDQLCRSVTHVTSALGYEQRVRETDILGPYRHESDADTDGNDA